MDDDVPTSTRWDVCADCGHWRFYHEDDQKALCTIVIPAKGDCDCHGFWTVDVPAI